MSLPQPTTPDTPRRRVGAWPVVFGLTAVVGGLMVSSAIPTGNRTQTIAPIAAAAGIALLYLAATRFEWFVVFAVFIRASLDIAKFSSSSVDTTGAFALMFIVASALWLLVQRQAHGTDDPTPVAQLIPPLGAFFTVGVIGLAFSEHPMPTLLETVRFGTLIILVTILGRILRDERRVKIMLAAVLASAFLPLLVGAVQLLAGGAIVTADGLSRVRGTFTHSNPYSIYLATILTLAVAVLPHVRWRWRVVLGVLIVASGVTLVMTYTRGAWIAAAAALLVVAVLQDRRLLWLMLAGAVVVILAVPSVGARVGDLSQGQQDSGASGNSLVWRFQYWREVLSLQDNPTLGIGLKQVELSGGEGVPPHNDLVRVYVETGIVGFVVYTWLLVTLALAARDALRRAPPGLPRGLAVAFAATLTGLVVFSLAANVITQLVILWYFMAIAAMAMCAAGVTPASASEGAEPVTTLKAH